jgi:hypothetical protein
MAGSPAYVLCRAGLPGAAARLHEKDADNTEAGHRSRAQAKEGNRRIKRKNIGSTLDSFLREEGIYEEVGASAIKRVVASQVEDAMEQNGLTKTERARRMHTRTSYS